MHIYAHTLDISQVHTRNVYVQTPVLGLGFAYSCSIHSGPDFLRTGIFLPIVLIPHESIALASPCLLVLSYMNCTVLCKMSQL